MAAGVSLRSELVPSVALLGLFDTADYDALLTGRILQRELSRRLPLAHVDLYAPLGRERPLSLDGGRPSLSLGPPDSSRKAALARRTDLVVITGNVIHTRDDVYGELYDLPRTEAERLRPSGFFVDGLGAELARACPVAWHAVGVPFDLDEPATERVRAALASARRASVRDERSRQRLRHAGAAGAIDVLPHPAVLADRLFPADVLRKRLDYLRAMGWYPADGRPVLVQTDGWRPADVAEVAGKAAGLGPPIAVVQLDGPARDEGVVDAIAALVPEQPSRLPAELTVEDVTAAIAQARAFVGTSAAGQAAARAFRVQSEDDADPAGLQARVDAELDALAALAAEAWSARAAADGRTASELLHALQHAEERYAALLRVHDQRGEQLVRDRLRYAEIVEGLEAAAGGLPGDAVLRQSELETRLEIAAAAEAEARFALERLRAQQPDG